ncbi:Fibronectin type III domain-containing protein 3B [Durusdinium trenchii]|uniref:Fibronectin type III domain-containing protein 3B n=1 Tax=Durusdinium trenchii TaxID=1381693 RepID=A0ABP0SJ51_9DINO
MRELAGVQDIDAELESLRALFRAAEDAGVGFRACFSQFDQDGSGSISIDQFASALQQLGFQVDASLFEYLEDCYRDLGANTPRVSHVAFLRDMLQAQDESMATASLHALHSTKNPTRETKARDSISAFDIMDRLQSFAREFATVNLDGYHQIWMELEQQDSALEGALSIESLGAALKRLGFEASQIDLRRLQRRFPGRRQTQDVVAYRDLLAVMLQSVHPGAVGASLANAEEVEVEDELKDDGDDEVGEGESVAARAQRVAENHAPLLSPDPGRSILERISKAELDSILDGLEALQTQKPHDIVDVRDVFEQFDFDLAGTMSRQAFFKCMGWLGFSDRPEQPQDLRTSALGQHLMSRLARHLEIGEEGQVSYRHLFVLWENRRRTLEREGDLAAQRSERLLSEIVNAVKDNVRNLSLSGIDFEDCFRELDVEGTGLLSHHQIRDALAALGVNNLSVVTLPQAMARFEEPHASGDTVLIRYRDFAKSIKLSIEADQLHDASHISKLDQTRGESSNRAKTEWFNARLADKDLFPSQDLGKEQRILKDCAEVIQTLRRSVQSVLEKKKQGKGGGVIDAGNVNQVLHTCFDDLDFSGDGTVQVTDLHEAMALLGFEVNRRELERVMEFPFLFISRALENGVHVWRQPRSQWELADERRNQAQSRKLELTFDTFKLLVGFAEMLPGEEAVIPHADPARHSHAWRNLFDEQEETHAKPEAIYAKLRQMYAHRKEENLIPTDAFSLFERFDDDNCDLMDESDAQAALAECFDLDISEAETHRLFRWLGVLEPGMHDQSKEPAAWIVPAGSCKVKYRTFLRAIEDPLDQPLSWEDEVFFERLRSHETALALIKATNVDADRVWNRQELVKIVVGAVEGSEKGPIEADSTEPSLAQRASRLIRRFEQPDGGIQMRRFLRALHLDLDGTKHLQLRRIIDGSSESFKALLQSFEKCDTSYSGSVTRRDFLECIEQVIQHVKLTEDEVDALCERFDVSATSGEGGMRIDYRAVVRYFAHDSSQANRAAGLAVAGKDQEKTMQTAHGAKVEFMTDEELAQLSGRSKQIWKVLWESSEETAQSSKVAKGSKKPNGSSSFRSWKVRKDLFEQTVRQLQKFDESICQRNETWERVGIALASIDMLAKLTCPEAEIPSLQNEFTKWTKEKGHAFTKQVMQDSISMEIAVTFSTELNPADSRFFSSQCRKAWCAFERKVKERMLIEQMQLQKRLEDQQCDLVGPDSRKAKNTQRTVQKHHQRTLMQLGICELERVQEEWATRKALEEKERDLELEKEREAHHAHFVKMKEELRVALPQSFRGGDSVDPVLESLIRFSNQRFVHAANFGDLQKTRNALLRAGHVLKDNFRDEDGALELEEFEKHRRRRREVEVGAIAQRRQGADHQFALWCERKQAKIQAAKFLRSVDPPISSRGSLDDRSTLWLDVGRALKAIDPKGLLPLFIKWSDGFQSHKACAQQWATFPPKSFEGSSSKAWPWVHLRSILTKICSKRNANFVGAFQRVAWQQLAKKDHSEAKRKLLYGQLLRCMPAKCFREVLASTGVTLRLHEEKRLMGHFCGVDEDGEDVANSIHFESFLQIVGFPKTDLANLTADSESKPDDDFRWRLSAVGHLPSGEKYELGLEERVQRGLEFAGAPLEVALDWRSQRAGLQRGLIFLNVISRANRRDKAEQELTAARVGPPLRPQLKHDVEQSTSTSLVLTWASRGEHAIPTSDDVSFFTLERALTNSTNGKFGGFELIFRDPPARTDPPSSPTGSFQITGLEPSTCYEFRLVAFNEHGASRPTQVILATLPVAPPQPKLGSIFCEGQSARCRIAWGSTAPSRSDSAIPIAVLPDTSASRIPVKGPGRPSNIGARGGSRKRGKQFELILRDENHIEDLGDSKELGFVVYRGQASCTDVVGLKPGKSYFFCVRGINAFGEPGPASALCRIIPLVPPFRPRAELTESHRSLVLSWDPYVVNAASLIDPASTTAGRSDSNDGGLAARGVLADWNDTVQAWQTEGTGHVGIKYVVQVQQVQGPNSEGSLKLKKETSFPRIQVDNLLHNAKFRARVRAVCAFADLDAPVQTPWSDWIEIESPPACPGQAILVHAKARQLTLRWAAPHCGAALYAVEVQELDLEAKSGAEWKEVYRGAQTLAILSLLKPQHVYRSRIFALSADGNLRSVPSLPAQHTTLSVGADRASRFTPATAKADFDMPCPRNALVLGDLIIFSERLASAPPADEQRVCQNRWRTVAGRVVALRKAGGSKRQHSAKDQIWFEVEWSSVTDADDEPSQSRLQHGARIQRTREQVFRFETELGVYRAPWAEESARQ